MFPQRLDTGSESFPGQLSGCWLRLGTRMKPLFQPGTGHLRRLQALPPPSVLTLDRVRAGVNGFCWPLVSPVCLPHLVYRPSHHSQFCLVFFFFLLFFYDSRTEREREAETKAEEEAGSMHREPDGGFDSESSGSRPGPKAVLNRCTTQGSPVSNSWSISYLAY